MLEKPEKEKKKINKEALCAYIFVLVPLIGYLVFNIFPLAISFIVQFCDMDYYDLSSLKWNNFANFKEVFTDQNFYLSIGVTLFVTIAQFISLFVALTISILLNQKKPGSKFFQIIYFIPYICSSVAVAIMWKWIFDSDYGIFNDIIRKCGGDGVNWFTDPRAYPWMIIIAVVWQAPGYGIVMYKAALSAVNPSVYEAADVDGAGFFTKLFNITLPAIAPTTFFLLMSGIMAGLQTFDLAQIFAAGDWTGASGPDNSGLTTVLYIYNKATLFNEMPVASVMSWLLFVLIFVLSVINFKLRRKWVDE